MKNCECGNGSRNIINSVGFLCDIFNKAFMITQQWVFQ